MKRSTQFVCVLAVLLALAAGAAGLTAVADGSNAESVCMVIGAQTVTEETATDTFYFTGDGTLTVPSGLNFIGAVGFATGTLSAPVVTASFRGVDFSGGAFTVRGETLSVSGGTVDSEIRVDLGPLQMNGYTGKLTTGGSTCVTGAAAAGLTLDSGSVVDGTLSAGTVELCGALAAGNLEVASGAMLTIVGTLDMTHVSSTTYPTLSSGGNIAIAGGRMTVAAGDLLDLPQNGITGTLVVSGATAPFIGTYTDLAAALADAPAEAFGLGGQEITGSLQVPLGTAIVLNAATDRLVIGTGAAAGSLTVGGELEIVQGSVEVANGYLDMPGVITGAFDGSVDAETVRIADHYTYGSLRALNRLADGGDTLLLRKSADLGSQLFILKDGVAVDLGIGHTLAVTDLTIGTGAVYSSNSPHSGSLLSVRGHLVYGVPPAVMEPPADNPGHLTIATDPGGGVLLEIYRGGNIDVRTWPPSIVSQWLRTTDGMTAYDYAWIVRLADGSGLPAYSLPALAAPSGYAFTGWYDAMAGGQSVSGLPDNYSLGQEFYAVFGLPAGGSAGGSAVHGPVTYDFRYAEGAVYQIKGQALTAGQVTVPYGSQVTVSLTAADGWNADDAFLHLNGQAGLRTLSFTAVSDGVVTATGLAADAAAAGGSGLTVDVGLAWAIIGLILLPALVLMIIFCIRRRKRKKGAEA